MSNTGTKILPAIKATTAKELSNWHGMNGRFTQHNFSRFYQDNSLDKAARKTLIYESYKQKEEFYNKEIDNIEKNL